MCRVDGIFYSISVFHLLFRFNVFDARNWYFIWEINPSLILLVQCHEYVVQGIITHLSVIKSAWCVLLCLLWMWRKKS